MEIHWAEYKTLQSWQQCRCTQGCEKIKKIKLFLFQLTLRLLSADLGHFQYGSFWLCKCHHKKVKISSHRNFHMNNFHCCSAGPGYWRALFNSLQVDKNIKIRFVQTDRKACSKRVLILNKTYDVIFHFIAEF